MYAGKQNSEGIDRGREFENSTFYSKIRFPVAGNGGLQFSLGFTEPDQKIVSVPEEDWEQYADFKTFFGNTNLDTWLSSALKVNFSFHFFKRQPRIAVYYPISPRGLWSEFDDKERLIGGSGALFWYGANHSLTVGMDANYGDVDTVTHWGDEYPSEYNSTGENDWAVFINDTMAYGKWTITPGVRYNYNNIFGTFVSPSIGVTYNKAEKTVLKCNVSKGFNAPSLVQTSIGGNFLPNPDLDPEEVWSYQLGAESGISRDFLVKSTLFYHRLSEELDVSDDGMFVNSGSSVRKGIEMEIETIPVAHISLGAGAMWIRLSPDGEDAFQYI